MSRDYGFTFTSKLQRPHGLESTNYENMLFSTGTGFTNKYYNAEYMRNRRPSSGGSVLSGTARDAVLGARRIAQRHIDELQWAPWKRIKLDTVAAAVPAVAAYIAEGLVPASPTRLRKTPGPIVPGTPPRTTRERSYSTSSRESDLVRKLERRAHIAKEQSIQRDAEEALRRGKEPWARHKIRSFFLRFNKKILGKRRGRFAIARLKQLQWQQRRQLRLLRAAVLRQSYSAKRREYARARFITRRFFRYGKKNRRYWAQKFRR